MNSASLTSNAKTMSYETDLVNTISTISDNKITSIIPSCKRKSRTRAYKNQRQLNRIAFSPEQTRITSYFEILNEVQILTNKNKFLQCCIRDIVREFEIVKSSSCESFNVKDNDSVLKLMFDSAVKNNSKEKHGYRHNDTIKMFAAYLRILGGKLLYETMHANLSTSIPSPSIISSYIADKGAKITEGVLRSDDLLLYLTKRKLPLVVAISEDATRMVGKICHDPSSNKLLGFSLPLNDDGMPITESFFARNVAEIQHHFKSNHISTMAYTIMAQSLVENVPAFALTLFSTDNKFTALDVLSRFAFIKRKLAEKGILPYTHASDGDARLLRAMKLATGIGMPPKMSDDQSDFKSEWFSWKPIIMNPMDDLFATIYFQDFIHVTVKLRSRVLRPSSILPLGKGVVSKSHLEYLIDNVSKDKHLLTATDINPLDRQNFESARKICDNKIQNLLRDHVPGSKSTILYLKMMNSATTAMLDPEMTISDRISNIWYSIFVLRGWRSWLLRFPKKKKKKTQSSTPHKKHKDEVPEFTIAENFVTCNAYTCIEINGHSLVHLIIQLRERNEPQFFLPLLMSSQPCESTYRQLRSMTTTNSTVINFNMFEITHRFQKVEMQNEIFATAPDFIKFPRLQSKKEKMVLPTTFPSNDDIISLIENAKELAIKDLSDVGIEETQTLNLKCQVSYVSDSCVFSDNFDEDNCDDDPEDDYEVDCDDLANFGESEEDDPDVQRDLHTLSSITGELMVKDYSNKFFDNDCLDESSIFVAVNDSSGKRKVVRKSTICWLLMEDKHKLSNDRLSRVKDAAFDNKSKRRLFLLFANLKQNQHETTFLYSRKQSCRSFSIFRELFFDL